MNNIKTYEVFKDWFKKKKEPVSILNYEDQIESFLDELKDLSIGYEKFILEKDILYCFIIRNYESKEDEINIFLEEIESFTKSIDIIFNAITNSYNYKGITPLFKFKNIKINNQTEKLFFIVLVFSKSTKIIQNNILYSYKPNEQFIAFSTICGALNKTSFKLGFDCNIREVFDEMNDLDNEFRYL